MKTIWLASATLASMFMSGGAALADEMGHHAATGFEIRDAIRERNNK